MASFDIATTTTADPVSIFWLRGASMVLFYTASEPITTVFTHYEMPLAPATGWTGYLLDAEGNFDLVSGLFVPNSDDFLATMADLVSVEVRGDWVNGNEVTRLDNFSFPAVPAPGAILLAGIGMALVSRLRTGRMI